MEIVSTVEGGKALLVLDGNLTVQTAPDLEAAIDALGVGVTELDIDLEKVGFLASAGLRVLVAAEKRFMRCGSLRILHPNQEVKDVFDMTSLDSVFTIVVD